MVEMPQSAVYALAELFDPRSAFNQYAKRIFPPRGQILMVDGRPQLEAAIELKAAGAALNKHCKSKLEKLDLDGIEAAAQLLDDKKALRAFANHRKARAKLSAAKDAFGPAVRLAVKPLSEERRAHLRRNAWIVTEMIDAIAKGKSICAAAEIVGERQDPPLSGRRVTLIWKETEKEQPYLKFARRAGFPAQ